MSCSTSSFRPEILTAAINPRSTRTMVGIGRGRLFSIGKLPVNMQVQGFYNVEKPDDLGPDWTLRFQIQVLLPKGGQ